MQSHKAQTWVVNWRTDAHGLIVSPRGATLKSDYFQTQFLAFLMQKGLQPFCYLANQHFLPAFRNPNKMVVKQADWMVQALVVLAHGLPAHSSSSERKRIPALKPSTKADSAARHSIELVVSKNSMKIALCLSWRFRCFLAKDTRSERPKRKVNHSVQRQLLFPQNDN